MLGTLPLPTLSFGNALQLPYRTADLTSVWRGFKNIVKAEPAASVCANMQSGLAFRHTPAQPCPGSQQGANNPAFAQTDGQMPNRLCVPGTSRSLQGAGLSKSHGGSGERHLLPILKLGVGENLYSQINSPCAPRNVKGRATISS